MASEVVSDNNARQEEAEYWVPSDAARLGMQFMQSKLPHAPSSLIMDFLRNMNKVF
jgi:hypothetical protein